MRDKLELDFPNDDFERVLYTWDASAETFVADIGHEYVLTPPLQTGTVTGHVVLPAKTLCGLSTPYHSCEDDKWLSKLASLSYLSLDIEMEIQTDLRFLEELKELKMLRIRPLRIPRAGPERDPCWPRLDRAIDYLTNLRQLECLDAPVPITSYFANGLLQIKSLRHLCIGEVVDGTAVAPWSALPHDEWLARPPHLDQSECSHWTQFPRLESLWIGSFFYMYANSKPNEDDFTWTRFGL